MKTNTLLLGISLLLFSCTGSIKPEMLYGKWNYTKVVNADPEEITSDQTIRLASPSINFTINNELIMDWGGKTLSTGKYKLDGKIIRFTESLGGTKTRDFPFLIKKLTANELVFQTMEKNYTQVSAERAD